MKHRDDLLWQRAERDLGATPERRAAVDGLVESERRKPISARDARRIAKSTQQVQVTVAQPALRARQFAMVAMLLFAVISLAARSSMLSDWIWPEESTANRLMREEAAPRNSQPAEYIKELWATGDQVQFVVRTLQGLVGEIPSLQIADGATRALELLASDTLGRQPDLGSAERLSVAASVAVDVGASLEARLEAIDYLGRKTAARVSMIRNAKFSDSALSQLHRTILERTEETLAPWAQ
jgi:hypothetical protein